MALYLICLFFSLELTIEVSGDLCLQALRRNSDPTEPPFNDNDYSPLPASYAVQAIIPTYKFSCDCVNISSWETYLHPAGDDLVALRAYDITFQVWRPSPRAHGEGCYDLVGQNVFNNFRFSGGGLAKLTPINLIITAQSGDVVGYYTSIRGGNNGGIQLKVDEGYDQNIIWFVSDHGGLIEPSSNEACMLRVGPNGHLSNRTAAAPMLKVITTTVPCPPSSSTNFEMAPVTSPPLNLQITSTIFPSSVGTMEVSKTEFSSPTPSPEEVNPKGTTSNIQIFAIIGVTIALLTLSAAAVAIIAILVLRRRILKTNSPYQGQKHNLASITGREEGNSIKLVTMKGKSSSDEPTYETPIVSVLSYSQVGSQDYIYPTPKNNKTKAEYENCLTNPTSRESSLFLEKCVSRDDETNICDTRVGSGNCCQEYSEPLLPSNMVNFNSLKEDPIYWTPASTTSELYSQLVTKMYCELPRDQIRLGHVVGSGQFGKVYKATWSNSESKLEVAVKTLKSRASETDEVKFLQEAAIMGQFRHRNVVKMHGVVTMGEPIMICLEFLDQGDLKEYLQKMNPVGSKFEDFRETQMKFQNFGKEIAAGMHYLSQKNFVHRDLAARNILLSKSFTCKVADFGMARDLTDDTYYCSSGGKIPVKWTAPEALLYKKYSTDSDVWSYGMVLFEIWSVGRKPFSTINNSQALTLIQKGFCQAPPPGSPRAIYELMVDCWNPKHQQRPSFTTICQIMNESPEKLLYWSPSDDSLSSAVGVCGAPLLEAEKLYPDLQKKYIRVFVS